MAAIIGLSLPMTKPSAQTGRNVASARITIGHVDSGAASGRSPREWSKLAPLWGPGRQSHPRRERLVPPCLGEWVWPDRGGGVAHWTPEAQQPYDSGARI